MTGNILVNRLRSFKHIPDTIVLLGGGGNLRIVMRWKLSLLVFSLCCLFTGRIFTVTSDARLQNAFPVPLCYLIGVIYLDLMPSEALPAQLR